MQIARHWRLKAQRYQLVGEICTKCGETIFPPREVCPRCASNDKYILYLPQKTEAETIGKR
jgi:uncharacterized protein